MDRKLIARFAIRETMGVLFMWGTLFWSAGEIDWWPAWILIAVSWAWILVTAIVILRHRPGLLAERLGPRKGTKRWDTTSRSIHCILQVVVFVVAGLGQQFGWSAVFSSRKE